MSETTQQLLKSALSLPASERAAIVQELLHSLDRPDPGIDELWAQEAEGRLAAYDAGEISTISAEDVFRELERS